MAGYNARMVTGNAARANEETGEQKTQSGEPIECRTCWNLVADEGTQCRSCREENYGCEGEG